MASYEQTLRLFERWCREQLNIVDVDKVTEAVIRRYINDLQERGKYSFYSNDKGKEKNFPDRRRDFRKPISVCTINNYIRNLRVFFNWMDLEGTIRKNPMKKVRQLKDNRKAKEYISDEDFKKLIKSMDKSYFSEHRDYAMIMLMIDSGMRLGECSCLLMEDINLWKDIVALSLGRFHTVGLRSDGTVVAEGLNLNGECNVTGWRNIVAISAGASLTLGLRADGTVVATGSNNSGQCDVSGWTGIKTPGK